MLGVPVVGDIANLPAVVQYFKADEVLVAIPSADQQLINEIMEGAELAGVPLKVLPAGRRPAERPSVGARRPRHQHRGPPRSRAGRHRHRGDPGRRRWRHRAHHGRRRVDRLGDRQAGGRSRPRAAACCSTTTRPICTTSAVSSARRPSSTSPTSATAGASPTLMRRRCGPTSSSTPRRTSTCRCSRPSRPRPCAPTCSAPTTWWPRRPRRASSAWCSSRPTRPCGPRTCSATRSGSASSSCSSSRPPGSRWCSVRFGNVLGSRGSVIPTFARQIADGGPVTVTDPRMTRFFMSVREAVQLVLQASVLSDGGEIFMLDMGEAVSILELAERMVRLSGHQVGTEIPIRFTGMRPGEKLAEDLQNPEEQANPTRHPSIVRLDGHPHRRRRPADERSRARAPGRRAARRRGRAADGHTRSVTGPPSGARKRRPRP